MIDNPCGKKPYATAGEARKAARAFSEKCGARIHFYHCLRCGAWHLSSADQARVKRLRAGER